MKEYGNNEGNIQFTQLCKQIPLTRSLSLFAQTRLSFPCQTWSLIYKAQHRVQAPSHYRQQNEQRICGVLSIHMDPELGHCALIISFTAPYWPNPEQTSHLIWPIRAAPVMQRQRADNWYRKWSHALSAKQSISE